MFFCLSILRNLIAGWARPRLANGEALRITALGYGDAVHQLHHEVRQPCRRRTRIEYASDIGVVHHSKSLALAFEAGDHLIAVHAWLYDLERDFPTNHY